MNWLVCSATVCRMEAASEPPWMDLRRVAEKWYMDVPFTELRMQYIDQFMPKIYYLL